MADTFALLRRCVSRTSAALQETDRDAVLELTAKALADAVEVIRRLNVENAALRGKRG